MYYNVLMSHVSNKSLKIVCLLAIFCLSCDIPKPKISRFEWQVNWLYNPQTEEIKNFLSIFTQVEGIDPQRTFPKVTIEAEGHDLCWYIPLTTENLQTRISTYSSGFLMTEDLLPGGIYELTLEDDRGLITTQLFAVNQMDTPEIADFPKIHYNRHSSIWPTTLFVYRQKNFFLATRLNPGYILPKKELGEVFYLYTFSPKHNAGLISGPYG